MDYFRRNKVNIQIFGRSKCFDTKKAERYFKERKIKYQLIDINRYGLSPREQESVKDAVGVKDMFDEEGKEAKRLALKNLGEGTYALSVLFNNPKLYKTPIVRNGRKVTIGYHPEVWGLWE